jgi:hypothetical protein
MLHPMQQATESTSSAAADSFAGLLASLTGPKSGVHGDRSSSQGSKKSASDWNDDDLADDAVTLSYENALRTHGRYRALDSADRSVMQPAGDNLGRIDSYELAPVEPAQEQQAPRLSGVAQPSGGKKHPSGAEAHGEFETLAARLKSCPDTRRNPSATGQTARPACTLLQRNLKSASITIRLSKEEAEQLHMRAAEAGLTVSAYLRSCTFEAERLRAMVKDTMAQLKAATSEGKQAARPHSPLGRWLSRLFTPWLAQRQMARV